MPINGRYTFTNTGYLLNNAQHFPPDCGLEGTGTAESTHAGLVLQGFKGRGWVMVTLGVLSSLIAIAALAVGYTLIQDAFGFHLSSRSETKLMGGLGLGFAVAGYVPGNALGKRLTRQSVRIEIPWSHIRSFSPSGAVLIRWVNDAGQELQTTFVSAEAERLRSAISGRLG